MRVTFEQSPKWGKGSEPGEPLGLSGGSQGWPKLSVICDRLVSGSLLAVMRLRSNEAQIGHGGPGGCDSLS